MDFISDILSPEAGQRRRKWLNEKGDDLYDTMQYYLGPTGVPDKLKAVAEALQYSDAGDYLETGKASRDLWNNPSIENAGRYATAGAALAIPFVGAKMANDGVDVLGDAIDSGVDDLRRFAGDEAGSIGKRAPEIERGDEILSLLSSGRGADVTDDMLDMGDPVLNARLNEYLFDNYDLPMDEASRADRQFAMGMGENYETYHGTNDDFLAFNSGFRPDGAGGSFNSGVYSAYRPDLAGSYTAKATPGGQILPLATRNTGHDVVVSAPGENWNMLPENALVTSNVGGPQKLGDLYPEAFDMPDNPGRARTNSVAREAGRDGAGSVKFEGIYDQGGFTDLNETMRHIPPQDIRTDLYPHNIRSRFARFDPRLAHLRNLSAATVPLGVSLGLTPEDEEKLRNYLNQ